MNIIQIRRAVLGAAITLISGYAAIVTGQTPPAVDNAVVPTKSEQKLTGPLAESEKPGRVEPSTTDRSGETLSGVITSKPEADASNKSTTKPNPQTPAADEWRFQFSPYLWIAGISGNAGIGNFTVDVSSGITEPNVHLNFGFMGTFEARKNKLVILTDLQYSNLGSDSPTPGPVFSSATADFKTFILDPEVGYRVVENTDKGRSVDILGGIRFWHLRSDLSFTAGILPAVGITESRGWVDVVGGIRGKMHLSPRVFITGKADLGGGGSKFTYQLFGGGGFQISKSIALVGGYRALSVDYDKDNFLFDMILHGPIMGIGFRF